ncbi:TPA: heat-shock protein Hsp20 [Patescibacteria group bacterium]|nr:heat-shock protein Hsp20 [Patescibacteria group bacterium]HCU47606.1 heat-shock protein Hsp20 [Patescibacteria group bacterium]
MAKFSLFKTKTDTEAQEVPTVRDTQIEDEWLEEGYEGQLSVDVYQTDEAVVIKSTIAGVKPEDLDVTINNDLVTIRGERRQEDEVRPDDYFYQECYWGGFSRSIILPVEVKAEAAEATLKNGVLTLILPKSEKGKTVAVEIEDQTDEE